MSNPYLKAYVELFGLYGSAVEHSLKVSKALSAGIEKAIHEQIAFVDATMAKLSPIASAKQPGDFVTAQTAMLKGLQEQVTATTKKIFEIQKETGTELKALADEGVEKFSPTAVGKLFPKAA